MAEKPLRPHILNPRGRRNCGKISGFPIFQKFSTGPSAGINKPKGIGMGLAICKAIIEAHDGKIWAESVKNVFSTFYFSLLKKRPN